MFLSINPVLLWLEFVKLCTLSHVGKKKIKIKKYIKLTKYINTLKTHANKSPILIHSFCGCDPKVKITIDIRNVVANWDR